MGAEKNIEYLSQKTFFLRSGSMLRSSAFVRSGYAAFAPGQRPKGNVTKPSLVTLPYYYYSSTLCPKLETSFLTLDKSKGINFLVSLFLWTHTNPSRTWLWNVERVTILKPWGFGKITWCQDIKKKTWNTLFLTGVYKRSL